MYPLIEHSIIHHFSASRSQYVYKNIKISAILFPDVSGYCILLTQKMEKNVDLTAVLVIKEQKEI